MKQVPVRLGPLALLLTVISICLTTLAILTLTTARADMRLAEKFAETVRTRYELEARGQAYLAGEDVPGDTRTDGGVTWKTIEQDGSRLEIGLDGEGRVTAWRHTRQWSEDSDIGNLWPGN